MKRGDLFVHIPEIKQLSQSGWSHRRIARKFGADRSSISYYLRGMPNLQIKHTHDSTFFSIPNPINSYWAGFIAADGCIQHGTNDNSKWISFCISVKDIDHLYKFKQVTNASQAVRVHGKYAYFTVYSQQWAQDLSSNFKIYPRKTLREVPPPLALDLSYHFLRGYFDGDGSVTKSGNQVTFLAGTKALLDWFIPLINFRGKIQRNGKLWVIAPSGASLRRCYTFMYFNSTNETRLARKYDRMKEYQEHCLLRFLQNAKL